VYHGSRTIAMQASSDLTNRLKSEARRLGFDALGIAPAVTAPGIAHYVGWLEAGRAAGMAYLHRQAQARSHPANLLDGVRSVIVGAFVYGEDEPDRAHPPTAKVARYARGGDYHRLLWDRLEALLEWLRGQCPEIRGRAVTDTAPLMERDFAQLAGLGWIGKNTMHLSRTLGSYTLLGALLVDIELNYDPPHVANHCGTCTRCLDACPTSAFLGPYQLDSRRCISYWTIEHRGAIPEEMAESLDGWVFGCDICQEVCPWNRKAQRRQEPDLAPRSEWTEPDLVAWLTADPAEFARKLKGTALSRAKRVGLIRNAALVLGQRCETAAVPALRACLADPDPVVRDAAKWALQRIGAPEAMLALNATREGRGEYVD
jgi:epoxyqueuosine reductase